MTVICFRADSSVVDEDVETTELLLNMLHCGGYGGVIVCVELDKAGCAFRTPVLYMLQCSFALCSIAGAENDVVVGRDRGKQCRGVEADAAVSTWSSQHVHIVGPRPNVPVMRMIWCSVVDEGIFGLNLIKF